MKARRVPKPHPVHVPEPDDEGEGLMNADTVALLTELKGMVDALRAAPDLQSVLASAVLISDKIGRVITPPAPVPAPDPAP